VVKTLFHKRFRHKRTLTRQGVIFQNLHNRSVQVQFDQTDSSVGGGAVLLKAADERLQLTSSLAACLQDKT